MTDWLTIGQAAEMLEMDTHYLRTRCRQGHFQAKKQLTGKDRYIWLLNPEQVQAEAIQRQHKKQMREKGYKRCPQCKKWLPESAFWKGQYQCKSCKSGKRKFAGMGSDPAPSDPLDELIGSPAKPEDSEKYACMERGFARKPLPVYNGVRVPLRKAFCKDCTAPWCIYHQEMTPEEVSRVRVVPTMYPAQKRAHWAKT